jgi:Helix-turn-helix domain
MKRSVKRRPEPARIPRGYSPRRGFPGRYAVSVPECAEWLHVTEQHVTNLIDRGELIAINVAVGECDRRLWRIPVRGLAAFIRRRNNAGRYLQFHA